MEESPSPPDVITVEEEDSAFVKTRKRNWARLIRRVWLDDPEICPRCGQKMVVLAAISSPDQDDVIERILRSRSEWDPPWKRGRPARGPPKQLELFEDFEESQVPAWNDELESRGGNQDMSGDSPE